MKSDINLNKTYKILAQYDKDLLSNFNKKEVSDEDYFSYGIYSELVTNALSIVINLINDNEYSVGLDSNCRAIIEALLILRMDKKNKIKLENKQMYRYSYAIVEHDNLKNSHISGVTKSTRANNTDNDLERFYEIACKHFHCSREELLAVQHINDPYFYLTDSLDESTSLLDILNKNGTHIYHADYRYSFFSFMIHPRFEIDPDVEDKIMKLRHFYIEQTLKEVLEFVEEHPLVTKAKTKSLSGLFFHIGDHFTTQKNNKIVPIKKIFKQHPEFDDLINKITIIFDGSLNMINKSYDPFLSYFMEKMKYLYIDMLRCLFLGFNEMVINKAKSFLEMYSILHRILKIKDEKEKEYRTLGFVLGSRIQINEMFKKSGDKPPIKIDEDDYVFLFDDFYKEKYQLDSISEFKKGLAKKNLYAFDKEPKTYAKLVRSVIRDRSSNIYKRIMTLYEFSLDVEHASGYAFNGSPYLFEYYSNETMSILTTVIYDIVSIIDPDWDEYEKMPFFVDSYIELRYCVTLFEVKKQEVITKYGITFDNNKK